MQAIQIESPKTLVPIDVAEPVPPGRGEALLRTHRMGVCGTDVSAYLGKFPFFDYPRIPGHELGVEVLEIGEGVANVKPGDRCSVEPYLNCGRCHSCRQGKTNCCEHLNVIGIMSDGGLCERFTMPANKLHRSEQLSYEQLALVETLAIGCHATHRGDPRDDDHVLIIGVGPIGLATLEFTRLTGATITVMDMVPSRLEFCRNSYAVDHTLLFSGDGNEVEQMQEITRGNMYALVNDATGNRGSMGNAVNYVAHTGKLVYVGLTNGEIAFHNPSFHRREMTIVATRNGLPEEFVEIIQLIEAGTVDTEPWITHRMSFDRVVDEFESVTVPDSGVIKSVIEVNC